MSTNLQRLDRNEKKELALYKKAQKKQEALAKKLAKERVKEENLYKAELRHKRDYAIAKHTHKTIKQKQKIEKYRKEEEFAKRPKVIQALTKRKKNKRGSSVVGQGLHKLFNPLRPNKKSRW
jgi:enoyl-CoA hydratase/carnithine racemase